MNVYVDFIVSLAGYKLHSLQQGSSFKINLQVRLVYMPQENGFRVVRSYERGQPKLFQVVTMSDEFQSIFEFIS